MHGCSLTPAFFRAAGGVQTQTYIGGKLGNTPLPPGEMDFAHAGSFY